MRNKLIHTVFSLLVTVLSNAQNIGIGTTPAYKLTVQTPAARWGYVHTDGTVTLGSYISTGVGEFGTKSNHPFYLFANNMDSPPAIAIDSFGINVGIGNILPKYNLDIYSASNAQLLLTDGASGQTALFSRYNNRLEIQPSDAFQVSIAGVNNPNFFINSNGVGIGTKNPLARLQVTDSSVLFLHPRFHKLPIP